MENWIQNQDSFYVTKDDQKIYFSDDFITSEERVTGLGKGIYSTYKYFDTYIWKENSTNHYYFEWIPKVDENIKEVHWPDSFVCEDKDGYSTIPYMQGLLIPNRYEYDYSHIAFDGQFTSCAAYMPWLSQTNNGKGYIAINKTPWDSKYTIDHDDKGTRLQFVWLTSLGKMRYKRVVRYSFESNMDYNRAAKIYREYVKETGLFKSLKEKEVLEQVGGKDNVSKVLHCQTRLRFNLKDESVVVDEKIEEIKGVLGIVRAGGQIQIVVGPEVKDVYSELCDLANFENKDVDPVAKQKEKITFKSIGNGILDAISGCMGPAIPAIVASAFFKMLVAILGPDLLNVIQEGNDLYTLLTFVGDAAFYFFPVIVGYTSAKKFNLNPVLGILMGAILIHPTFVGLIGKPFTVYGIPCNVQSYASSIVPIILSNWIMSYVARFFDRVVPGAIRSVFSPAFTIAVMLPIALCVFGPAGAFIGKYVVGGLFSLEGVAGFIGIGLIAALYPVLVMTGMHMVLITALFQVFATKGFDGFAAVAVSVSSFSIMGVGIGAFFRLKNKEQKALALSYGITAIVAGTSEPTIYGICTKYKKPFIGLLAGGFIGGAYAGLTGVIDATLVPSSNVFAALCFLGKSQANVVNGIIACVIAFVSTALLVYFFGFDKNEKDIQA